MIPVAFKQLNLNFHDNTLVHLVIGSGTSIISPTNMFPVCVSFPLLGIESPDSSQNDAG